MERQQCENSEQGWQEGPCLCSMVVCAQPEWARPGSPSILSREEESDLLSAWSCHQFLLVCVVLCWFSSLRKEKNQYI